MGLFSFIKNAGAKVFGIGKTSKEERIDKANMLAAAVETLGFDVRDLNIEVEEDTAIVWGEAGSQETREKVVLVLGNTEGIALHKTSRFHRGYLPCRDAPPWQERWFAPHRWRLRWRPRQDALLEP